MGYFLFLKKFAAYYSYVAKTVFIGPCLAKKDEAEHYTGFVDAVHGKGGGYRLNRKPEEYTVGSILKLTEGGLSAVSCTAQGPSACSRTSCCRTLPMWEKLDKMVDDFFESVTLQDLLSEQGL